MKAHSHTFLYKQKVDVDNISFSHFPHKFQVVFLYYMESLFFLPASAEGMDGLGGAFHCTILSLIEEITVE